MINMSELDAVWADIEKNADYTSETEYKNYIEAVKKAKAIIGDGNKDGLNADQAAKVDKVIELAAEV